MTAAHGALGRIEQHYYTFRFPKSIDDLDYVRPIDDSTTTGPSDDAEKPCCYDAPAPR